MSLNVEGIANNLPFAIRCSEKCDILLLQEHWLFNCQRDFLAKNFPLFHNTSVSTDDTNPISQICLPRGWGGASILWRKSFDHLIQPVIIESNRITAIKINNDTLLLNVYMPSGNGSSKKGEYLSTIDHLHATLSCYVNHNIIVGGDFNMDPTKEAYKNDRRLIALNNLTEDFKLSQIIPQTQPTMFAHNGRDTSFIDLIYTSDPTMCSKPCVTDKVPENTSCHTPVCFLLQSVNVPTHKKPSSKPAPSMEVKKRTLKDEIYCNVSDRYLQLFNLDLVHPHTAADILTLLLKAATLQSSEVYMSPMGKRKKAFPQNVIGALKKSRKIHALWKAEGRPGPNHNTSLNRRKASRAVRAALRTYNAQRRDKI